MKLKDHVQKLYEGGQISQDEHEEFHARYRTSEGEERVEEQQSPALGSHAESPMPSQGPDEYLTSTYNDYRNDAEPEEMTEPSREFLDAFRKKKRSY